METENSKFEGWAVVELFGHMREAGYVTTEYFGSGALFRIEVPPLPEREITLARPEWINDQLVGAGSKISRGAVEGRTRFVGPSAVYALNPCSKDAAFQAIEGMTRREVKVVELVKRAQLQAACTCGADRTGPEAHADDCPLSQESDDPDDGEPGLPDENEEETVA